MKKIKLLLSSKLNDNSIEIAKIAIEKENDPIRLKIVCEILNEIIPNAGNEKESLIKILEDINSRLPCL